MGGLTQQEIGKQFGICGNTVYKINRTDSYEEYKEYQTKQNQKNRERTIQKKEEKRQEEKEVQIVEHRQSITLVANQYMMEEMRKQTELLKTISAKLAFIVEELTGTTTGEEA